MTQQTITAVANTAGVLLAAGIRSGARVENYLTSPIYISKTNPPSLGAPSIRVPPVNAAGDCGVYCFDGAPQEDWYYKTAGAGDFGVVTW